MKTLLISLIVALVILAAALFYGKTRFDAGFSAGEKQAAETQTAAALEELKQSKAKAAALDKQAAALRLKLDQIEKDRTKCAEILEIDITACLPEF